MNISALVKTSIATNSVVVSIITLTTLWPLTWTTVARNCRVLEASPVARQWRVAAGWVKVLCGNITKRRLYHLNDWWLSLICSRISTRQIHLFHPRFYRIHSWCSSSSSSLFCSLRSICRVLARTNQSRTLYHRSRRWFGPSEKSSLQSHAQPLNSRRTTRILSIKWPHSR